jgi:alkylation response protein AidB-like acyl-CoA dehydrogenase
MSKATTKISSPDDPALADLCRLLAEQAGDLDRTGQWPAEQLRLCGQYGVYEWFLDRQWGGQSWDEAQAVRGYLALSAACLTTTFILTQRTGACRRIAGCDNRPLQERLLPGLASGELFATVGISHLTTSRRHLGKPVLTATAIPGGFRLDGFSPWVTGDEQLPITVPSDRPGLRVAEPLPLVGVAASSTGPVHLDGVEVISDWVIAGPRPDVMSSGIGAGTGGYETSTLAIGVAQAALDFLAAEAARRPDLKAPLEALQREHRELRNDLLAIVRGDESCTKESIRQRANSLVLRASQSALAAAKGSGYIVGHPAGRWCREALFFLVWSCPQPVANANLCELAGIEE